MSHAPVSLFQQPAPPRLASDHVIKVGVKVAIINKTNCHVVMSSEGSGSAGRGSQPASDSQASSISNWSDLQLSQGSVNTVLNAVGLSGLEGDRWALGE